MFDVARSSARHLDLGRGAADARPTSDATAQRESRASPPLPRPSPSDVIRPRESTRVPNPLHALARSATMSHGSNAHASPTCQVIHRRSPPSRDGINRDDRPMPTGHIAMLPSRRHGTRTILAPSELAAHLTKLQSCLGELAHHAPWAQVSEHTKIPQRPPLTWSTR